MEPNVSMGKTIQSVEKCSIESQNRRQADKSKWDSSARSITKVERVSEERHDSERTRGLFFFFHRIVQIMISRKRERERERETQRTKRRSYGTTIVYRESVPISDTLPCLCTYCVNILVVLQLKVHVSL